MSEKALKPALTDVGLRYNTKLADVLPPDLAEPLRTFGIETAEDLYECAANAGASWFRHGHRRLDGHGPHDLASQERQGRGRSDRTLFPAGLRALARIALRRAPGLRRRHRAHGAPRRARRPARRPGPQQGARHGLFACRRGRPLGHPRLASGTRLQSQHAGELQEGGRALPSLVPA